MRAQGFIVVTQCSDGSFFAARCDLGQRLLGGCLASHSGASPCMGVAGLTCQHDISLRPEAQYASRKFQ